MTIAIGTIIFRTNSKFVPDFVDGVFGSIASAISRLYSLFGHWRFGDKLFMCDVIFTCNIVFGVGGSGGWPTFVCSSLSLLDNMPSLWFVHYNS